MATSETPKKKTGKRTARKQRGDSVRELQPERLRRYTVPEDLPPDERELLDKARLRIQRFEKRMMALTRAASERYVPNQSAWETDETSAAVFGDEEYADFLAHVETVSQVMLFRLIAGFLGVPRPTLDQLGLEALRAELLPQPEPSRTGNSAVSFRRAGRKEGT